MNKLNNWQNVGIMVNFAYDNIEAKYIPLFLYIVRYSFGFGNVKTNKISQYKMSKDLGISRKTIIAHLLWLSNNNYVKIIKNNEFIGGGGSYSNDYAPVFPENGQIKLSKQKEEVENEDGNPWK